MKLSIQNKHERDRNIIFEESTHKYTILTDLESNYTSTTTWVHSHFQKFDADNIIKKMRKSGTCDKKYPGMTDKEIKDKWESSGKEQSKLGTNMHNCIENYMNGEKLDSTVIETEEWKHFLKYVEEHQNVNKLIPYRTEWFIYNENIKICGAIDMVYELEDGTLAIYDWKRVNEIKYDSPFGNSITECLDDIPDTNFWHYSLQLNMYKYILESKYNKKVSKLALVVLHPINETWLVIPLPDLSMKIKELVELL